MDFLMLNINLILIIMHIIMHILTELSFNSFYVDNTHTNADSSIVKSIFLPSAKKIE